MTRTPSSTSISSMSSCCSQNDHVILSTPEKRINNSKNDSVIKNFSSSSLKKQDKEDMNILCEKNSKSKNDKNSINELNIYESKKAMPLENKQKEQNNLLKFDNKSFYESELTKVNNIFNNKIY